MREENVQVFQDTRRLCKNNKHLVAAIKESNSKQYVLKENDFFEVPKERRFEEPAEIVVSKRRSLEAAERYAGQKVCVHNFASAISPGGGVLRGSSAQEEAICRCSTLYFNISEPSIVKEFHNFHRNMIESGKLDVIYNDDCIYTPGVVVFKTDDGMPEKLPKEKWYHVDVITCAAPNLRADAKLHENYPKRKIDNEELRKLHVKRMRRILDIAKAEKEDVVILGAFGCGAFLNPPEVVAEAMKVVVEEYKYDFKTIEFAVFCTEKDMRNYETFKNILL